MTNSKLEELKGDFESLTKAQKNARIKRNNKEYRRISNMKCLMKKVIKKLEKEK